MTEITEFPIPTRKVDLQKILDLEPRVEDLETVGAAGAAFTSGGPVATASTANLTLSGEQTIDGVLTSTSRVLVKDQTAPENNGVYVTAAGTWYRATDMDVAGEVESTAVYVSGGTTQGGMSFATYSVVTTLGTDAIAFVQINNNSGVQDQIDTLSATTTVGLDEAEKSIYSLRDTSAKVVGLEYLNDLTLADARTLAGSLNSGLFVDMTTETTSRAVIVRDIATPANATEGTLLEALSGITFTSHKMCVQADGSIAWQPHNQTLHSGDFTNAAWTKNNTTVTSGQPGPKGGTDGTLYTSTSAFTQYISQNLTFLSGVNRTDAILVKKGTSRWFCIEVADGATVKRAWFDLENMVAGTVEAGLTANVSSADEEGMIYNFGWYRLSVTRTTTASSGKVRFLISETDNSINSASGRTAYIARVQGHSGVNPLEYLATTTAARIGVPYDWTNGYRALRLDQQASYRGRYSDDFTNAVWTKSNATAALDATGPHGEACSTITATAGDGYVNQAVTSAGSVQMGFAWVRRKTGTGTLSISMDGGATYKDVTADIGKTGEAYKLVYQRGYAADPNLRFKIGTGGDAFEISLANVSTTQHVPAPFPSVAADVTQSSDQFNLPLSELPSGSAMSAYFDVVFPETNDGAAYGASQIGFLGAGSLKALVQLKNEPGKHDVEFAVNDGTAYQREVGDLPLGRVQVQLHAEANRYSVAFNGNVPYYDSVPGSITPTHLSIAPASTLWLRRLVMVPEGISEETDALRRWYLDTNDANINDAVLGTHMVYRAGSRAEADLARIPALEVSHEQGDICEIITMCGEKHDPGYNVEHPQRALQQRYKFDRSTGLFTALSDLEVFYTNGNWAFDEGGIQGNELVKIKTGPYRGRLLTVFIQQDSVTGTPDDRNLYRMHSDDNGRTWSAAVKIIDQATFSSGDGFVAHGENSTGFQVQRGPQEGRVYYPLNVQNASHGVMWCDDFKVGGDGSGTNWSYSTTRVPNTNNVDVPGTLTEPAVIMRPNDDLVLMMRNSGGGEVAYAISTDYGVTFGAPALTAGDNESWNVNHGLLQDDPLGGHGRQGRMIFARATTNGRNNHKIQESYDANVTLESTMRLFSSKRFVGYCPIRKAFTDDDIYIMMAEIQPTVSSNVDTSQMLVAFRYPGSRSN